MLDFLAAAIDPDIKHHLSVITFLPLVGALFLAFINRKRERELKATAFFFSLITFIASLPVLFDFNVGAGYDKRLMETAEWIPVCERVFFQRNIILICSVSCIKSRV